MEILLQAVMSIVLQFSEETEARALPILLRHSIGMALPNRAYIVDTTVAKTLRDSGIIFREVTSQVNLPFIETLPVGERV